MPDHPKKTSGLDGGMGECAHNYVDPVHGVFKDAMISILCTGDPHYVPYTLLLIS